MPDTYTPFLNLTLPEIGASRDTWGAKINANLATLDLVGGVSMPVGAVIDFAGANPPPGWLVCDGRWVSRTTYAALFNVLGAWWGAGDGSTSFALPNLNGRSTIGPGTLIDQAGISYAFSFTEAIGFVSNYIGVNHLPGYNLVTDAQGQHDHSGVTAAAGYHSHTTDAQGTHSHGAWTLGNDRDHSHSGSTDAQGNHAHNSYVGYINSGGYYVAGGSGTTAQNDWHPTDYQGNHAHNFSTGGASTGHLHQIAPDGNHAHNVYPVGDHQHGIAAGGNHQHNVWSGGGGVAFEVLGPILCMTKIIFAGAATAASMETQMAPQRIARSSPARGRH